jgi:hypothetical protein
MHPKISHSTFNWPRREQHGEDSNDEEAPPEEATEEAPEEELASSQGCQCL